MRKVVRLGWLLVAVGAWLAAVGPAAACSCAGEPSIAQHRDDESAWIFVGTALPRVGDNVPVEVQGWFRGPADATTVLTATGVKTDPVTGAGMANTCGVVLTGGPFIVVAQYLAPDQPLEPSSCSPYAHLSTPQGQKLLAEATSIFGEPKPPGGGSSQAPATATPAPGTPAHETPVPPTPAPSASPTDDAEQARTSATTTLLLGTGLAALVVFGVVWALARARPRA